MKKFSLFVTLFCVALSCFAADARKKLAEDNMGKRPAVIEAEKKAEAKKAEKAEQKPVVAQESAFPVHFYASLAWDSRYVVDGFIANPDPVASVTAGITAFGFFFDVWSQQDMTGYNNGNDYEGAFRNDRRYRSEEVDYTLGYSYTFDTSFSPITVGAKWQYYQYPAAKHSRSYWTENGEKAYTVGINPDRVMKYWVSLDDMLAAEKHILGVGAIGAYNLTDNAAYGDGWVAYGYKIDEKLTAKMTLTGHFYSGNKNGNNHSALNSIELKPSLSYAFNDHVSLNGYIACAHMTSKTSREVARSKHEGGDGVNHRYNWWGGVSLDFYY